MKVKILIVDDDESTLLLKQGYRVENAQARASAPGRGGQSPARSQALVNILLNPRDPFSEEGVEERLSRGEGSGSSSRKASSRRTWGEHCSRATRAGAPNCGWSCETGRR